MPAGSGAKVASWIGASVGRAAGVAELAGPGLGDAEVLATMPAASRCPMDRLA
jgi:hypothetical protein